MGDVGQILYLKQKRQTHLTFLPPRPRAKASHRDVCWVHCSTPAHTSCAIGKFADDAIVVRLMSGDESAYWDEGLNRSVWRQPHNLILNAAKTGEINLDLRKHRAGSNRGSNPRPTCCEAIVPTSGSQWSISGERWKKPSTGIPHPTPHQFRESVEMNSRIFLNPAWHGLDDDASTK